MISNVLRKLTSFLSSWYSNKDISKKKDDQIRKVILKKINEIKINKDLKKLT